MGRPNYTYEKRQKEIAKKQKKEAKRLKRLEKKAEKAAQEDGGSSPGMSVETDRPIPAVDTAEPGSLPTESSG